jgi:hypothetical protein
MKNLLVVLMMFCSLHAFGQKVNIEEGLEALGSGYNKAYKVYIPHADVKLTTKRWSDFLKKNKAKVKTLKGGLINGQNTVINGLGPDSIQVYSKINEAFDGVMLAAAFDRNGTFLSPSSTLNDAKLIQQLLKEWATEVAKEALDEKIEDAAKLLAGKMKEKKNLEEDNTDLIGSNEKMKKQIAENERKITDNSNAIEKLKGEVVEQGNNLQTIKDKVKDL